MDDAGRVVREAKVASEPDALQKVLKHGAYHFKRIGLEAGPLSQWRYSAFAEAGLPQQDRPQRCAWHFGLKVDGPRRIQIVAKLPLGLNC